MSPWRQKMQLKSKVLVHSAVAEFISCWGVQGEATLSLTCKEGKATIAFSTSLEGPESPLGLAPTSTSRESTNKEVTQTKKKLSPSQIRRNLRRKEEFCKKKSKPSKESTENEILADSNLEKEARKEKGIDCNLCGKSFESENGLKIHKGKSHKEILRSSTDEASSLSLSPEKEAPREEKCVCCGKVMSPHHQCDIFRCRGCEQVFSNEDELFEHEDTTHPLLCHICYNFFKDEDSKFKHFMENHKPN